MSPEDSSLIDMIEKRKAFAASSEKLTQPRFVKPSTSSALPVTSADGPAETPDNPEEDANGEF